MNYTSNAQIDIKLQTYIDVIVQEIKNKVSDLKSIIIGGGFGRGEGSAEIVNGKVVPLNDFDIFIVTENKTSEALLNQIANASMEKIGIDNKGLDFYNFDREEYSNTFYLDIKCLTLSELGRLPPMARYYELRNASNLVYGDENRNLIPNYTVEDLPITEGFRFLMNRMALLAMYFSMDFRKKISNNELRGLVYLGWNKSFLACCESLLILNGKFVPSYRKRMEILSECFIDDFPELASTIPKLPKKVREAIDFKFNPSFSDKIDPVRMWVETCHYIGEVSKYFVGRMLGKKINTYSHLSYAIQGNLKELYFGPYGSWYLRKNFGLKHGNTFPSFLLDKYMKYTFFRRIQKHKNQSNLSILTSKASPDLLMYAALPNLLFCVDKKMNIDKQMLSRSGVLINKILKTDLNIKDEHEQWNKIAENFSHSYALFSFLKIV